jgi:hypothetical protein
MERVVAEPKDPAQPKLRDWPMFRAPGRRRARKPDGRPLPRISEVVMAHVEGTPAEKLAWLRAQRSAGRLDGDDPDEIAEAEALLAMLARLSPKDREQQRHLDELLDEGLMETFPASDPVSVGHFTGTEPPTRPVDRRAADATTTPRARAGRTHARVRGYG